MLRGHVVLDFWPWKTVRFKVFPLYQGRIDSNRRDFLNVALSDFPIQLFSVIRQWNLNNTVRIRRIIFFSLEAIIFDCELRRIITLDSVCIYFLLKHVTQMCTNMAAINSVTSCENDLVWRNSSCWSVAKTRCLRLQNLRSACRNSDGIWSVASSNSKSCGSLGLSLRRRWLAALAMFSGLGKLGHGTSSRSSNRTSLTMADAGLKTSATALALTL